MLTYPQHLSNCYCVYGPLHVEEAMTNQETMCCTREDYSMHMFLFPQPRHSSTLPFRGVVAVLQQFSAAPRDQTAHSRGYTLARPPLDQSAHKTSSL